MVNHVQRTNWGSLFNISYLMGSIWVRLFEGEYPTTSGAVFFRAPQGETLPLWCSWAAPAGLAPGVPVYAGAQDSAGRRLASLAGPGAGPGACAGRGRGAGMS